MIKGFFFDLDGTLVNTYEADYMAYRDAIKEVTGIEVPQKDFAATNGQELRDKLKILTPGVTEEEYRRIATGKKRHYPKYLHLTVPNEWLIQFVAHFAEHHATVLVTIAKEENARHVLEHHHLTQLFSHLIFGEDVPNPKPAPDLYLVALQRTNLKPQEAIAFEDSDSGIASAEAAGVAVVRIRDFAA